MNQINSEESDEIQITNQRKRQKTISEYFGNNSNISKSINNNIKETLIKLIQNNDSGITYKTHESLKDYWKSFKRILLDNEETDYVKCINCPNIIKCNSKTSNNSLIRHNCNNKISISNNETIDCHLIKPLKNNKDIKSDLADAIALFVAKDLRPINIIKGEGFKQFAQHLINIGTKYPNVPIDDILPSDTTVRNHITIVYNNIRQNLLNEFSKVNAVGITCDHWSYEILKVNYLTITAQYIKESQTFSRVLATISTLNKTANTTKSEVNTIINDFKLNDVIKYYVTDNASSMILAFSEEVWFGCSAHNINLIHKHTFEKLKNLPNMNKINSLIDSSKELVTYFKQSGLQNKLNNTLKQSIDIRWDSKLAMLESIRDNLLNIKEVALTNSKIMEKIVDINDQVLNDLISLLKPFYDLRLTLCQESGPTFHLVLPTKQKMFLICRENNTDSDLIKGLKRLYEINIKRYFKVSELHFVGSMLYPPLRNLNNLATNEEKTKAINLLKSIAESINIQNTQTSDKSIASDVKVDFCLEDFIDITEKTVSINESYVEVQNYLDSTHNFIPNTPIMQFWEQNKLKYPRLFIISKSLLSIPATNLSSERNFSYAGITLSDKRSSLDPSNVNKLLFTRSNFDLYKK